MRHIFIAGSFYTFPKEVGQLAAACVLVNTAPGKAGLARKKIADIPGVKSSHAVTGAYDIIETMTSVVVELP